ncbi:MAG: Cys-tRNA(Pro) deacylase [Peptostreptococcaceae bacterium]|nr:Cys-tRNA(Pro) deacylase [Peptostreptococcaceae bacterium]
MQEKTNVMRILDQKKIPYQMHSYEDTEAVSGKEVAQVLGEDPRRLFKTLVTFGKSGRHYVFLVAAEAKLDLKKAAALTGEKSLEMLKSKELLPLTGYVHGGCSPIGMKKVFPTFIDKGAEDFETIFVSAGKIGYQIEIALEDLAKILVFTTADLEEEDENQ